MQLSANTQLSDSSDVLVKTVPPIDNGESTISKRHFSKSVSPTEDPCDLAQSSKTQTRHSPPLPGPIINNSAKRSSASIAPLNLPKRFAVPNQSIQDILHTDSVSPGKDSTNNTNNSENRNIPLQRESDTIQVSEYPDPKDNTIPSTIPSLQPLQPLQPLPQMPRYQQQMFYNPATGQVLALPVQCPTAMQPQQQYYPVQQPFYSISPRQQYPIQQQVQQPIYYMRTATGQFIPMTTVKTNSSKKSNQQLNKRHQRSSVGSATANSSQNSNIQSPEQLQRQQIQFQMRMHPNLSDELQTPNISDVYLKSGEFDPSASPVDDLDEKTDKTDTEFTYDSNNTQNPNSQASSGVSTSTTNSANSGNSNSNSNSNSSTGTKTERILGTLTLNGFTYKYSQTLSGDLSKDKDLFDRLTENAWKACVAKR